VLVVFHSEVIRKGKAHKPSEFGRLVRIDEVENGIVSGYAVLAGNLADTNSFVPALEQHQAYFGRGPEMATADRGFSRRRTNAKPRSWESRR
jgi:IS5 family transposase